MHKVPRAPIIIAAVARGNSDDASAFTKMHFELMDMLHAAHLYPISHAADGTEVERTTQRDIEARASDYRKYSITTPIPALNINTRIYYHDGHPFVLVQDSSHARKTARNQLFSGARLLAPGRWTIYFAQLREFVMTRLVPLFQRDVVKVDKQDDRAAAQLFSAQALQHHLDLFPSHPALSIYLFVLSKLIDAWQNRSVLHIERIQMVLRAQFCLMAWRHFVKTHPAYSLNIHFISLESFDIFRTLCDSLISLVILYRKHYPAYPLLLWLHSTEGVEHVFGLLRQLKKDFSYIDMLYFEAKA